MSHKMIAQLREQAVEIADKDIPGWGNTMSFAADEIARLCAVNAELVKACEYALACAIFEDADPVTQMMRAALAKARGERP